MGRQESTPRWRAFLLSCFLCGVCKCSSDQDQEYRQDTDNQAAQEEPVPSTSQQDPQVLRRDSSTKNKVKPKKEEKLSKKRNEEQNGTRKTPNWFVRVLGRRRQRADTQTQTARAAGVRATKEEQGTSSILGRGPQCFSVEACLETFFQKHEREQKRLAETFFIRRHKIMVEANRTWETMPLRNDDAPRSVTFEEPFLPAHHPRRIIINGARPWMTESTMDYIMRKRQERPVTAAVSNVQEVIQPMSEPEISQPDVSVPANSNAHSNVWDWFIALIVPFGMVLIVWLLKELFEPLTGSDHHNLTCHH